MGPAWESDDLNARMSALTVDEGWEAGLFLASAEEAIPAAREAVEAGWQAWEQAKERLGIDIERWLLRRAAIRLVQVPKQGASRIGVSDPYSLYASLDEAQRAFVTGLPLACLALIRTAMESALVLLYGAPSTHSPKGSLKEYDTKLEDKIDAVEGRLPQGANRAMLHVIRQHGNGAVHLEGNRQYRLGEPEKVLLEHLQTLRILIEEAPATPYRD